MEFDTFIKRKGKHFECEICGNRLATGQCVTDHMKGKKHRRLVNLKITREEQTERSIFVGNLRRTNSELELMGHFNKFGPISRIIIDKEKSAYAIVEFVEKQSVAKAVEEEKQTMNGLHIVVRPREVREFVSSGITQRNAALEGKKKKEDNLRLETQMLMAELVQKKTIDEQLFALSENISLSPSSLQIRYLICHLLQEVFSEFFANCRVFPYGSSVNGCGGNGSDLDIFLSLNWSDETWMYTFASLKQHEQVQESSSAASSSSRDADGESDGANPTTASDGSEMEEDTLDPDQAPEKECLEFVAQIIQKCVPSCHKVQTITSARKPVIKFVHKDSGLHCDIILNNRLVLRNTELIHFYCTLDPVVRPLILLIRRWAKLNHVAENSGPGPRLTNYALTWMVILFLQTKGIIPTIEELREAAGCEEQLIIDGWDCSLRLDCTMYRRRREDDKPGDLMQSFFEYYSNIDWAVNCLCPRVGKLLPIGEIPTVANPSSDGQFKRGCLNIQDPLELTHNTTSNVNEKTVKILSQEIKKAAVTCKSSGFQNQVRNVVDVKEARPLWGIQMLFGLHPREQVARPGNYRLEFPMKDEHLTEELSRIHVDPERLKEAWAERITCVLLEVLRDTLTVSCEKVRADLAEETSSRADSEETTESKMEVDPEEQEPPTKRQRMQENENDKDGLTADIKPVMYSCSLKHDIWVGRRKMRRTLQRSGSSSSSGLVLEKLVTEKLIEETGNGQDRDETLTEFHLEVTREIKDNTFVRFAMIPLKGEAAFKLFYHFLESFLPKIVEEYRF
ncbi:speckle targeted PIP5K1A-regulated poly(A) polymerase-like isoform X1 [Apostichopus japonicus]|uniref:speckle targeted PIP5K1A-regulated poly(A) polymerase-like isoform X1 n=2 Tax=Stichopus japonicus TaxID=307972 RepID=UPI003AB8FA71